MSKSPSIFLLLLAVLTLSLSCGRLLRDGQERAGTYPFSVGVALDGAARTRADAYTERQDYEEIIGSVQYFVFGQDGLEVYESTASAGAHSFSLTGGDKTIYAVVNGPDLQDIATEEALLSQTFYLRDESRTEGFQMMGSSRVSVSETSLEATVRVSRIASRIALMSVANALPDSASTLEIERVWLSNVRGDWSASPSGEPVWHNRQGRSDDARESIIGGNAARGIPEAAQMTYLAVGQSASVPSPFIPEVPLLLYCYPNASTVTPDGWQSWDSDGQRTTLVIEAKLDGESCYYPIVLEGIGRNCAYTVYATIHGAGSDDPNEPVDKTAAGISINVGAWEDGGAVIAEY